MFRTNVRVFLFNWNSKNSFHFVFVNKEQKSFELFWDGEIDLECPFALICIEYEYVWVRWPCFVRELNFWHFADFSTKPDLNYHWNPKPEGICLQWNKTTKPWQLEESKFGTLTVRIDENPAFWQFERSNSKGSIWQNSESSIISNDKGLNQSNHYHILASRTLSHNKPNTSDHLLIAPTVPIVLGGLSFVSQNIKKNR